MNLNFIYKNKKLKQISTQNKNLKLLIFLDPKLFVIVLESHWLTKSFFELKKIKTDKFERNSYASFKGNWKYF